MNSLNSVLIEGKAISLTEKGDKLIIAINSTTNSVSEIFYVVAKGQYITSALERLSIGQGIRAVGKLSKDYSLVENNNIIIAEHLEFKHFTRPAFSQEEMEV